MTVVGALRRLVELEEGSAEGFEGSPSSESVWTAGPDGRATGWRKYVASDQQVGTLSRTASLQVCDDLDSLREHVPQELYTLVEAASEQPVVEDLDI